MNTNESMDMTKHDYRFIPIPDKIDSLIQRLTALEEEVEKLKPKRARNFKPPTLEEATEYLSKQEHGRCVDPEVWYSYYETRGWSMGGKNKMKDWKASLRYWIIKNRPRDETPKEEDWFE